MAVKRILLSEAEPGMELANDIYDDTGRMLVPYGTILNKMIIERMEEYKIVVIKINEKGGDDLYKENRQKYSEIHQQPGYFEKIKETEDFKAFAKTFHTSVDEFKSLLNDVVVKNTEVDLERMLEDVNNIIESNKTGNSMLDVLNCMRGYDDLTYVHSMNVALICNMIAGWLNYSEADTYILTAAGLLHDIGKVKIPKEIISKPGKLTDSEYEIIKNHTMYGYEILKDCPIDERIKNAALMHHERYDGRGYPGGLRGNLIDETARIVAVADVYDAMTADRVYREGICPFDVIGYFQNEISVFDPRYLLLFLEKTAETYVSNKVLLNNGTEAKILMINKAALGRPVVMTGEEIIDLSKKKELKISKLL